MSNGIPLSSLSELKRLRQARIAEGSMKQLEVAKAALGVIDVGLRQSAERGDAKISFELAEISAKMDPGCAGKAIPKSMALEIERLIKELDGGFQIELHTVYNCGSERPSELRMRNPYTNTDEPVRKILIKEPA
jgi:hypothetical protein